MRRSINNVQKACEYLWNLFWSSSVKATNLIWWSCPMNKLYSSLHLNYHTIWCRDSQFPHRREWLYLIPFPSVFTSTLYRASLLETGGGVDGHMTADISLFRPQVSMDAHGDSGMVFGKCPEHWDKSSVSYLSSCYPHPSALHSPPNPVSLFWFVDQYNCVSWLKHKELTMQSEKINSLKMNYLLYKYRW